MGSDDSKLESVVDGYANFLKVKDLAKTTHQPHMVRWIGYFLIFGQGTSRLHFWTGTGTNGQLCAGFIWHIHLFYYSCSYDSCEI